MTKDAAIQSFFESFGLNAYPAMSVPASGSERPEFPYIVYTVPTGYGLSHVSANASVYYRSENMVNLNAKVNEISEAVGDGYKIKCDNGGLVIRKRDPFAEPLGDDSDDMIKRKVLFFDILFATTY